MIRTRTALAFLLLASCKESEVTVGELQEVMILPALPNPDLDVLFVIDNSPSMLEEQQALATSFPLMMDALDSLDGGRPNLHIGVVTTDMGVTATNGTASTAIPGSSGGCTLNGDDGALRRSALVDSGGTPFISDVANTDGTRTQNYDGELRDVFAGLAQVGAAGCGFEQPLHAMRRALENPLNAGFLRPEANLAVVILSDEDDCSFADRALLSSDTAQLGPLQSFRCTRFGVTCDDGGETPDDMNTVGPKSGCHANDSSTLVSDVASYANFLASLKPYRNMVMVAAIAGDTTPVEVELRAPPQATQSIPALAHSCTYDGPSGPQTADPAVRLAELVAAFPARSALTSVCNFDLSAPLTTIGRVASRMMGDPCIGTPLEDTSTEPGLQPSCEVSDGPTGAETRIPSCLEDASGTCWSIVLDTGKCGGIGDGLRLQITRPSAPTSQVYAHLRCLTR